MKKPKNMSREELQKAIASGKLPANDIIRNNDTLLRVWKLSKKEPQNSITPMTRQESVECMEIICNVIESNRSSSVWDNYQPDAMGN